MKNKTMKSKKRIKICINVLLAALIFLCWGNSLWIHAKAHLAQRLIAKAWTQTLKDQGEHKPWPWADTWPVAKLSIPGKAISYYVLQGANGSSLAFAPGYLDESVSPEQYGAKMISGHRDTHFKFLEHIENGELIKLNDKYNQSHSYAVSGEKIYDITTDTWQVDIDRDELKLITCYPFNAINPGGPLRLVLTAKKLNVQKAI